MHDHDEGAGAGAYTLAELRAMAAAGDVELVEAGTSASSSRPEASAFDRAMVEQLDEYNRELVAREGPDALTSDRQLRQAVLAAEQDPGTLAHALAASRERLGLDRDGLASWLGIDADRFAALALERRPDPAAPAFVDQVRRLAERYGAAGDRLAEALA